MFIFATTDFLKYIIILLTITILFKFFDTVFVPVIAYVIVCPLLVLIYTPFVFKKFNFFKYKIIDFKEISKKVLFFGIPVFA